jgi:hypothetical protein
LTVALVLVARPADARPAGTADVGWSCTVPSGYTFTQAKSFYGACGISGYWVTMFYVVAPADQIYACTIPTGFVYDGFRANDPNCSTLGPAALYHLRVPSNNLLACMVPPNWTFIGTRLNQPCSPFGPAALYTIHLPARGMWACSVPPGFTYSQYRNPTWGCAISDRAPGVFYLLQ